MSPLEKHIVRAWSAVVARGNEGTPIDVAAKLQSEDVALPIEELTRLMAELRRRGALP